MHTASQRKFYERKDDLRILTIWSSIQCTRNGEMNKYGGVNSTKRRGQSLLKITMKDLHSTKVTKHQFAKTRK